MLFGRYVRFNLIKFELSQHTILILQSTLPISTVRWIS